MDLSKKKKIKAMNTKVTTNRKLSPTKPKKQKKNKNKLQRTRTGTESQKWRSHGKLSRGKGLGENGRKGTGIKKHNW